MGVDEYIEAQQVVENGVLQFTLTSRDYLPGGVVLRERMYVGTAAVQVQQYASGSKWGAVIVHAFTPTNAGLVKLDKKVFEFGCHLEKNKALAELEIRNMIGEIPSLMYYRLQILVDKVAKAGVKRVQTLETHYGYGVRGLVETDYMRRFKQELQAYRKETAKVEGVPQTKNEWLGDSMRTVLQFNENGEAYGLLTFPYTTFGVRHAVLKDAFAAETPLYVAFSYIQRRFKTEGLLPLTGDLLVVPGIRIDPTNRERGVDTEVAPKIIGPEKPSWVHVGFAVQHEDDLRDVCVFQEALVETGVSWESQGPKTLWEWGLDLLDEHRRCKKK